MNLTQFKFGDVKDMEIKHIVTSLPVDYILEIVKRYTCFFKNM